jgi:hypothetical protein
MEAIETSITCPPATRSQIRYRNHFRWRIIPPEGAADQGFTDRSFENKKKALKYQKLVKAKFPDAACCLIDTGRWYDSFGRAIH